MWVRTTPWMIGLLCLFACSQVQAQVQATAPSPQKLRNERQKAAIEKLGSSDPDALRQALEVLGELGGEPAAKAVSARLRDGMPPLLIEQAIDTLVMLGRPSAAPVLLELTLHRRATVRQRAVMAVGALKVRSAQSALLYCLDDPSPDVRSAAVLALGDVGDQRALSALFSAADHGADKALESVGRIVRPQQLPLILARAQAGDVTPIAPALQVMMEREDYPLAGKLAVIDALAKLASPSARARLVQWLDTWKTTGHPRLRKALFDALKQVDQTTPPEISSHTTTTTITTATPVTPVLPAPLPTAPTPTVTP